MSARMIQKLAGALLAFSLISTAGCAQLLGQLRRDLDDGYYADEEPVRGGILSNYEDLPPSGRSPASGRSARGESDGWVNRMNRENNLRDQSRTYGYSTAKQDAGSDEETSSDEPVVQHQARRVTRGDFVDASEDAGSLWSTSGQTNFFFSKNRTRSPGDLITINIEADMVRDLAAEVKRALSPDERDHELALLEKPGASKAVAEGGKADEKKDEIKQSKAAPDSNGAASFSQVDLKDAIGAKAGDTFLAEVIERFPNGNYKIRGTKRLPFRGGSKLMTLVGVVRGNDLSDDDKVNSGRLYEYRLEVVR